LNTNQRLSRACSIQHKTDHHDIAEILLKVALNTITLTLSLTSEVMSIIVGNEHDCITCTCIINTTGLKKYVNSLNTNQRLSRACIVHLVIKRTNWSYVKTMSCSGSHLGIPINIHWLNFLHISFRNIWHVLSVSYKTCTCKFNFWNRGCRDHMVVGFITSFLIFTLNYNNYGIMIFSHKILLDQGLKVSWHMNDIFFQNIIPSKCVEHDTSSL
jgi:hypothetical protein